MLEVKIVKNVTGFVTVPATYKLSPHSDISAVSHQLSLSLSLYYYFFWWVHFRKLMVKEIFKS